MKFSVITPCFNAEKTISQTIEGVLYQRGDIEIQYIIVDGGSTDNTIGIIREYEQLLNEGKIKINCTSIEIDIISEPDNGMYDALAKGLQKVTGEITSYINADDYYLPNAFLSLLYIFEGFKDINWITGTNCWYNAIGSIVYSKRPFRYKETFLRDGLYNGQLLPHVQQESTFWRSELNVLIDIQKLKGFQLAGDFYLWHTFANANHKLHNPYIHLSGFRVTEGQKSEDTETYRIEMFSVSNINRLKIAKRCEVLIERILWNLPHKYQLMLNSKYRVVLNNSVLKNIKNRTNLTAL